MREQRQRNTIRKSLIEQTVASEPVLLEELTWIVFTKEMAIRGRSCDHLTRSYRSSFARTIRVHMDGIVMYKLHQPYRLPYGLLARAALYRLASYELIVKFRTSSKAEFYCSYDPVLANNVMRMQVILQLRVDSMRLAVLKMPVASAISIVARHKPNHHDITEIANVPWPLLLLRHGRCYSITYDRTPSKSDQRYFRTRRRSRLEMRLLRDEMETDPPEFVDETQLEQLLTTEAIWEEGSEADEVEEDLEP